MKICTYMAICLCLPFVACADDGGKDDDNDEECGKQKLHMLIQSSRTS